MNHFSDEELVLKYKKTKNEKFLEVLIKRYLPQVYGFARNYTGNKDNASDMAQEVFVKVWKNIGKFDPRKASPRGGQSKSFKTWIFTIAKHTAIDWLRHKTELSLDESFDVADDTPSILEQLIVNEKLKKLSFALAKIPASYSSIINLYIKDGLNFREISETLQAPLNTIKSRYRRGLSLLKKLI